MSSQSTTPATPATPTSTTALGSIASITRGMHWHVVNQSLRGRWRVLHTSTGYVDAFQRAENSGGAIVMCSRESAINLEQRLNNRGFAHKRKAA